MYFGKLIDTEEGMIIVRWFWTPNENTFNILNDKALNSLSSQDQSLFYEMRTYIGVTFYGNIDNVLFVATTSNFKNMFMEATYKRFGGEFDKDIKEVIECLKSFNSIFVFDYTKTDSQYVKKHITPQLKKVYSEYEYKSTNGSNMGITIGKF